MSLKLERAAAALVREFPLTPGTVNTLAIVRGKRSFIRVLVDPAELRFLRSIPSEYRGYPVVIEPRPQSIALAIGRTWKNLIGCNEASTFCGSLAAALIDGIADGTEDAPFLNSSACQWVTMPGDY